MTELITAPGRATWRTHSETAGRFEGRDTGGVVSGFVVDLAPGRGPGQHVHPYPETFVVLRGTATFLVDGEELAAAAGDVLTVAPATPHGFTAAEPDGIRLVAIHANPEIVQTFL